MISCIRVPVCHALLTAADIRDSSPQSTAAVVLALPLVGLVGAQASGVTARLEVGLEDEAIEGVMEAGLRTWLEGVPDAGL